MPDAYGWFHQNESYGTTRRHGTKFSLNPEEVNFVA